MALGPTLPTMAWELTGQEVGLHFIYLLHSSQLRVGYTGDLTSLVSGEMIVPSSFLHSLKNCCEANVILVTFIFST